MSEIHAEVHELNRLDFYCALRAVLEHVGTLHINGQQVGVMMGANHLSATDGITAGYARVGGTLPWVSLPARAAKDLLRSVKPNKVSEREETLQMRSVVRAHGPELHVGVMGGPSEVFDDDGICITSLDFTLWPLIQHTSKLPRLSVEGAPAAAGLLARFKSAERHPSDRLRVYPKLSSTGPRAVVTVGDKFVGLIAGLSAPAPGVEVADATLEDWGL